jgi:predicted Zn-ribbon and HTH transcriptional regulator
MSDFVAYENQSPDATDNLMPLYCETCGHGFPGNGVGCTCPECGSGETEEDQ